MARLDLQRQPTGRVQARKMTKNPARGYFATDQQSWGNSTTAFNRPDDAKPTSASFTGVPGITASDATNAGRLAGLGFRANPQTNWTTGQKITVNTFFFNWTGAAWAAGAHA